jgi:hypothetical protein
MYMRVRNLSLRAHAVPEFPKAYHIVRRAALRLALTRALVKAAQIIKQMQARSSGASAGASITSIFDMALAHAAEARQLETAEKEEKREPIPLSLKSLGDVARSAVGASNKPLASAQGGATATKLGKWGKLQRTVVGSSGSRPGSPSRSFRADAPGPRRALSASKVSPALFASQRAAEGGMRAAAGDEAIAHVNDRLGRLEASMAACLQELRLLRHQPATATGGGAANLEASSICEAEPTSPEALRHQRRRRPRRNKLAGPKGMRDSFQSSERRELREENAREYSRSQNSPFISASALDAGALEA